MAGPAMIDNRTPIINGLDFNAPRIPVTATTAPVDEYSIDDVLGLSESKYDGLKSVADTGYYMKGNKLYEPYTITQSAPSNYYGIMGYGNQGGGSNRAEGTIEVGQQAFKPVKNASVPGFVEMEDGSYEMSRAYIDANRPKYQGQPQQNLMPALSLATMPQFNPNNSFGVARFLNQDTLNALSRADDGQTNLPPAAMFNGGGKGGAGTAE
jgi:hypothetical protein